MKKKYSWPIPIPAALVVIVAATVIAYFGNFEEQFNVAPVGNIPNGWVVVEISVYNIAFFLQLSRIQTLSIAKRSH